MSGVKEKLMARVSIDDISGCWNWTGYTNKYGTPYFAPTPKKRITAPRASFQAFVGDIDDEKIIVVQECKNKKCINPDHLMLIGASDHAENKAKKQVCKNGHSLEDAYIIRGEKRTYRTCRKCAKIRAARKRGIS